MHDDAVCSSEITIELNSPIIAHAIFFVSLSLISIPVLLVHATTKSRVIAY